MLSYPSNPGWGELCTPKQPGRHHGALLQIYSCHTAPRGSSVPAGHHSRRASPPRSPAPAAGAAGPSPGSLQGGTGTHGDMACSCTLSAINLGDSHRHLLLSIEYFLYIYNIYILKLHFSLQKQFNKGPGDGTHHRSQSADTLASLGAGQASFRGVPVPQAGAQSRVQQQVVWVGMGTGQGVALQRDACSRSDAARPVPAVTAWKDRREHECRSDRASCPRAI